MLWTACFLLLARLATSDLPDKGISRHQLENWASKFGGPLSEFARSVTKYSELHGRFQQSRDGNVSSIALEDILPSILHNVKDNFEERVQALEKLRVYAEERALEYHVRPGRTEPRPSNYYNAKRLNREPDEEDKWPWPTTLLTRHDPHFGTSVNSSSSSVHVPTSIYEQDRRLLEGLDWSSDMDVSFSSNLQHHPALHWQYFGSVTGFLRQFPAMAWPKGSEGEDPDLFDSRMRPWYTAAANSGKNVVILQDTSGSMTGRRREIAKHVVYTILDTLTDNDFVNVFNFSGEPTPIVPCFYDTLVQADLENVREFKVALDTPTLETQGMADFPKALEAAFKLLRAAGREGAGSGCNEAIFLITDGSPYYYEEVFREHKNPMHPVRLFTYLIGKEVTDFREVRWMACTNQGYYVHVSTLGEVQEQVLKYLPVMSRPMVIQGRHDVSWTPVYADLVEGTSAGRVVTDEQETLESDWAWAAHMAQKQRAHSERFKWLSALFAFNKSTPAASLDAEPSVAPEMLRDAEPFQFVVTVSTPVFDLRNKTTDETGKAERIANFLGVVGTDVPLEELRRLTSPFQLGVNGYAFILTNNGHVVLHPHWRPTFRGLLKPNYNTVDWLEVELADSNGTFRNNDSVLLQVRREMIERSHNYRSLDVRIPQADFRRVFLRTQRYEYAGIPGTPYTLGVSAPDGMFRFTGQIEVMRVWRDERVDVTSWLETPGEAGGRKWSVNPGWHYCKYIRSEKPFESAEELLLHFLGQIQRSAPNWKWRNTGVGLSKTVRHSARLRHLDEEIYECDRELVQSLVFDANVTNVFTSAKLWKFNKNESQIIQIYGALMAFIATRSGLTRWIHFGPHADTGSPPVEPSATEALWYQRAVDHYASDPTAFVFSVPFDAGTRSDSRVTATRAVFVTKNGHKAPVAVVGIHFDHAKWAERFFEITGSCIEGRDCKRTCSSEEFDCFVLDDNGFILIGETHADTGRFFGEVDGMVMEMLVNSEVYRRVRVQDFQAVCLQPLLSTSPASLLLTPLTHLRWLAGWLASHLLYFLLNWPSIAAQMAEEPWDGRPSADAASINKTKLRPCDREYELFTFGPSYNSSTHGILNKCGHNCDGYFNVHHIPYTNLILVVTDGRCRCGHNATRLDGREVDYGVVNATEELCRTPRLPLHRKAPPSCYNFNPEEKELLEDCGGAGGRRLTLLTAVLSLCLGLLSGGGLLL